MSESATRTPAVGRVQATFVLEQHLGHATFAANLRAAVEADPTIAATWVPVRYETTGAWWERVPGLPQAPLGFLRGRTEVRAGTRGGADITFFNTQVPAVIGGQVARGRRYVLCTDITPAQYDRMAELYRHRADGRGPIARAKAALNRRVFNGAAANVAWSTWTRDSLVSEYGVPPAKVHVIPPGVDLTRWTRQERRDGDGPVQILFVGGDFERKGGMQLLAAFNQLPRESARLAVVTKSDVPSTPGVTVYRHYSPNDPGLVDLYHASDIFALPSRAEAFGIAAAEASAAGLPVVGAQIGGLSDVVIDGVTGFVVPPADAGQLADRLARLVADRELRLRQGAAARDHAAAHFDASRNAQSIVRLLHECAADEADGDDRASVE